MPDPDDLIVINAFSPEPDMQSMLIRSRKQTLRWYLSPLGIQSAIRNEEDTVASEPADTVPGPDKTNLAPQPVPRFHWPTAFVLYAAGSILLALLGYVIREPRLAGTTSIETSGSFALIAVVACAIALFVFRQKWEAAGTALTTVLWRTRHLLGAWASAGLATYGIAELLGGSPRINGWACVVEGPLAFHWLHGSALVLPLLVLWTAGFWVLVYRRQLAHRHSQRFSLIDIWDKVRKALGLEPKVPAPVYPDGTSPPVGDARKHHNSDWRPKRVYLTFDEANKVAIGQGIAEGTKMSAYRCPVCDNWHVGHDG